MKLGKGTGRRKRRGRWKGCGRQEQAREMYRKRRKERKANGMEGTEKGRVKEKKRGKFFGEEAAMRENGRKGERG